MKKEKNTKKQKNVKKAPKESYFKGVKKELKLVKWPTIKEVAKYTIATLIFILFLCGFFILLNLLMSVIKGWFV